MDSNIVLHALVVAEELKDCTDGNPAGVLQASDEQVKEAQRKTSLLHAGLFRRLAQQPSAVRNLEHEPIFLTT